LSKVLLSLLIAAPAAAAQGEMGTGVPEFGSYAASLGGRATVFSLASATIPFLSGCTRLYLLPSIFGADSYRIAIATILAAKAAGKRVRFYSHSENGCNVDYVQLLD
jgi:hypothetical protein